MQAVGGAVRFPYAVGNRINVAFHDGVGVVSERATAWTAEVVITDILAVRSFKSNQVTFMYELNNTKVVRLADGKK